MSDEIIIKCHDGQTMYPGHDVPHWRPAETGSLDSDGYSRNNRWRTCWYCGSMHPEDLLAFIAQGAKLESADWKYGWPHKFYVSLIANPLAGQPCKSGSESGPDSKGGYYNRPIMGTHPPTLTGKFYSTHLSDIPRGNALFAELSANIRTQTRIEFILDDRGLGYKKWAGVPPA